MVRHLSILACLVLGLSACTPVPESTSAAASSDGRVQKVYRISNRDVGKLQFRMLDSVNALRQSAGSSQVQLNAQLNAAAATHARDMSVQNRPWHFGSDGSSPIDRVRRVGYTGSVVGENIAETYESELEILGAWMGQPDTRRTIVSQDARDMGFSWHQEPNGKIWWVLVMGNPSAQALVPDVNPSASRLVPQPAADPTDGGLEETPGVVVIQTRPLGS